MLSKSNYMRTNLHLVGFVKRKLDMNLDKLFFFFSVGGPKYRMSILGYHLSK